MPIHIIKIKPEFIDERGFISRIVDQNRLKIRSILYVQRKKGSIGANHYHKKDAHYQYILQGKIKHWERNMKTAKGKLESVVLIPGDLILVSAMTAHKDEFIEDTSFLVFTTETRSQKKYENDTVRLDITHS